MATNVAAHFYAGLSGIGLAMASDEHAPYRVILRKVGYLLIAIGAIAIGVLIYSSINRIRPVAFPFMICIIPGIFLARGSLSTARTVASWAALIAVSTPVGLILVPILKPIDLLLLEVRSDLVPTMIGLAMAAFAFFLAIWVYKSLRSPAVVDAQLAAGHSDSPLRGAFIRIAMIVVIAVLFDLAVHLIFAESSTRAVELAKAQVGAGYKFYIESIHETKQRVQADLTAYNATEEKTVHVEWQR